MEIVEVLLDDGNEVTSILPVAVEEMHQSVKESVPLARSTPISAFSAAGPKKDDITRATDSISGTSADEDAVLQRKRHHRRMLAEAFRTQDHSLRISVSKLAACCGYHPYKSLPELVQDLVYQGFAGRELLRQDTENLEIELVDTKQQLKDMANRAGVSAAMDDVLRIKDGSKIVPTVDSATKIQAEIIDKASRTLSKEEMNFFSDGIRYAVNTGYGTAHEDTGLDLYEKMTGWRVGQRNAEVRAWPFQKVSGNSVAPMSKAVPTTWTTRTESDAAEIPKRSKLVCDLTDDASQRDITYVDEVEQPFFVILGSVDGIRDELAPGCEADDDSWVIRRVIVECKHRMQHLRRSPPFYEQIQATAYCLMYDVTEADIVQVLRVGDGKDAFAVPTIENEPVAEFAVACDEKVPTLVGAGTLVKTTDSESDVLTSKSQESVIDVEAEAPLECFHLQSQVPVDDPSDTTETVASTKGPGKDMANITISISRISIDDEGMQHRKQWHKTLLPRLRMFVEAVYRIRSEDDKRYRLLQAVADRATASAWQILFDECPELKSWVAEFKHTLRLEN